MAFSSLDEECSTIRFLRYRERLCFSWLVTIILINRHPTNWPTQHLGLEVRDRNGRIRCRTILLLLYACIALRNCIEVYCWTSSWRKAEWPCPVHGECSHFFSCIKSLFLVHIWKLHTPSDTATVGDIKWNSTVTRRRSLLLLRRHT